MPPRVVQNLWFHSVQCSHFVGKDHGSEVFHVENTYMKHMKSQTLTGSVRINRCWMLIALGMTREVAIRELVAKSGYPGPCQVRGCNLLADFGWLCYEHENDWTCIWNPRVYDDIHWDDNGRTEYGVIYWDNVTRNIGSNDLTKVQPIQLCIFSSGSGGGVFVVWLFPRILWVLTVLSFLSKVGGPSWKHRWTIFALLHCRRF